MRPELLISLLSIAWHQDLYTPRTAVDFIPCARIKRLLVVHLYVSCIADNCVMRRKSVSNAAFILHSA